MRPLGVGVASVMIAVLMVGSDSLQRSAGLPASAGFVFQAIVVLCVLLVDARRNLAASSRDREWIRRPAPGPDAGPARQPRPPGVSS